MHAQDYLATPKLEHEVNRLNGGMQEGPRDIFSDTDRVVIFHAYNPARGYLRQILVLEGLNKE